MFKQPPVLVSHGEWVNQVVHQVEWIYNTNMEETIEKPSVDRFMKAFNTSEKIHDGSENIGKVLALINEQPDYDLSPFQKTGLKEIITCLASKISENPPAGKLAEILKRYNIPPALTQIIFLLTKRRGGKTDLLTMVVAALLIVMSKTSILYYSLFDLTCQVACDTVAFWIDKWHYGHLIKKKNAFEIVLLDENGNKKSVRFINGQSKNVNYLYLYIFLYLFFKYFLALT
jgi:hypothetical protein